MKKSTDDGGSLQQGAKSFQRLGFHIGIGETCRRDRAGAFIYRRKQSVFTDMRRRYTHCRPSGGSVTRIQRATVRDVPALLPLVADYWNLEAIPRFEPQRVAVQLKRLLSEPSLGVGWIAITEGVAVGYLLAVYVFSLEHLGITAEIDELFVLPSLRGSGVGAKLLEIAESEFRRARCTNVSLQLSRDNDSARAFYHHRGYTDRSAYELLDKPLQDG